jgi:predicted ester cyclase
MFSKICRTLFFLFFILLFITACSEKISNCELNKVTVGQYYEGLNMGIKKTAEIILHDHFTKYVNGVKADKYGPAVYLEEIGKNKENNIDNIYTIDEMIAESNNVVVMWNWQSTNVQFENAVPITLKGVSIFEFEDSRIRKVREFYDQASYYHQLGYKYISPENITGNNIH